MSPSTSPQLPLANRRPRVPTASCPILLPNVSHIAACALMWGSSQREAIEGQMQPIHILIDGEGRILSSPFFALRNATNRDIAEHALIAHAVENLGYVHVQEWPRGLLVFYRALV